jgi:hypothetical protein
MVESMSCHHRQIVPELLHKEFRMKDLKLPKVERKALKAPPPPQNSPKKKKG